MDGTTSLQERKLGRFHSENDDTRDHRKSKEDIEQEAVRRELLETQQKNRRVFLEKLARITTVAAATTTTGVLAAGGVAMYRQTQARGEERKRKEEEYLRAKHTILTDEDHFKVPGVASVRNMLRQVSLIKYRDDAGALLEAAPPAMQLCIHLGPPGLTEDQMRTFAGVKTECLMVFNNSYEGTLEVFTEMAGQVEGRVIEHRSKWYTSEFPQGVHISERQSPRYDRFRF